MKTHSVGRARRVPPLLSCQPRHPGHVRRRRRRPPHNAPGHADVPALPVTAQHGPALHLQVGLRAHEAHEGPAHLLPPRDPVPPGLLLHVITPRPDAVGQLPVPPAQATHGVVGGRGGLPAVLAPHGDHATLGGKLEPAEAELRIRTALPLGDDELLDALPEEALDVAGGTGLLGGLVLVGRGEQEGGEDDDEEAR